MHSKRLTAPEGKMWVSTKDRVIGYILRIPLEKEQDYQLMDEAEAFALDEEWHSEWYDEESPDGTPQQ